MYVYCVYPVMLNSSKQLSTYVTRAETSIVPIVFDDVLYEVRAYIIIVSYMNQITEKGYRFKSCFQQYFSYIVVVSFIGRAN